MCLKVFKNNLKDLGLNDNMKISAISKMGKTEEGKHMGWECKEIKCLFQHVKFQMTFKY